MITRVFTICALLVAVGCGGGESTSDKVNELEDVTSDQGEATCECFAELQFASEAECLSEFSNELTPTQRTCALDAFALDSAASDTYLDCLVDAETAYLHCLHADLDCSDFTGAEACAETYDTATESCTLPDAVNEALGACFSG